MTVAEPVRSLTPIHEAIPGTKPLTAELLWATPRVGNPAVSPDGRTVAVPVTTYAEEDGKATTRIWLVDTESGDARPVTTEETSSSAPVFSPQGRRLAFLRSKEVVEGKDPTAQVWILPLDGGEAECVTEMPLGCMRPIWMPDGSGLVFSAWLHREHLTVEGTREAHAESDGPTRVHITEERFYRFWDRWLTDERVPHIFTLDLETGALTDRTPLSTLSFDLMSPGEEYDIAPDGESIVYCASDLSGDSQGFIRWDVFHVVLDGRAPVNLTADNPAHSVRPRFSPDGAGILYGRSEDPAFYADRMRLYWYDPETGEHSAVLTEWDRNPGAWTFSAGGDLYFQADDDGRFKLYVLPASDLHPGGDEVETAPTALTQHASAFSPAPATDGHVFYSHMSLSHPPEVWRAGIRGGEPVRLTWFTEDALADVAMGPVKDLRYEGAGGDEIQSFVLFPPDYDESKRYPILHMVHGGPFGILGDFWHWRWHAQTVAAAGYVVAVPQFHGSTSYGSEFARSIMGELGQKPLEDTMKGVDVLVEMGIADEARMVIGGGSYGGYLTAWATSQTDRFACAINHAGVFDHHMQWGCDHTYHMEDMQGGSPFDGQEQVDECSPARNTAGMNTPMLVLHGERDYRVPYYQGIECYNLLKAKGVPARLVFFQDENHWVLKRENSLTWYAEVLAWMDRWTKQSS